MILLLGKIALAVFLVGVILVFASILYVILRNFNEFSDAIRDSWRF